MTDKLEETILQKTYIQKSKVFLLPLTGIKKDRVFSPHNTYVSSEDLISEEYPNGINVSSNILILCYSKSLRQDSENILRRAIDKKLVEEGEKSRWDSYEEMHLFSNKRFMAFHETQNDLIYTFDLSEWSNEFKKFIQGRYSLFTDEAKSIIINYRKSALKPIEQRKLLSYLYPYKEEYIKQYARDLGCSINDLKSVKELCNAPDLERETYKFEIKVH